MDPLLFTQQDTQARNGASARASRNVPASVSQGIYQFIYGSQPQSSMTTPAALPGPAQGQWSPRPLNSNVASEASVLQSQRINGDRERSDVERLLEFVGLTSSDPLRVAGELGAGARRAFERSAELGEQVGSSVMSRYFLGEWPENWQESTWQGFFEDRWREVAPEASEESIREAAARSARAASLVQYEPLDLLLGDAADVARVGGAVIGGAIGAIPVAERTVRDIMDSTGGALRIANLPESVRNAMARIGGVTDDEGVPQVMYHGTNATYRVPKPSEFGLKGEGFYFTNDPEYAFTYADSDGMQIRPGIAGGRLLDLRSTEPFSPEDSARIFRALPYAPQDIKDIVLDLVNTNSFTGVELDEAIEEAAQFSEGIYSWLENAGYAGVIGSYSEGVIFNPSQDYIVPWDIDAMQSAISRNADLFTPEEMRQIDEDITAWQIEGGMIQDPSSDVTNPTGFSALSPEEQEAVRKAELRQAGEDLIDWFQTKRDVDEIGGNVDEFGVDVQDVDTWDELTIMANQPIMDVTPQSIANKYRFEVERNYDRNDELGRQRIQRVQEEGDRLAEYVTNNYGFLIDSLSQIPGELERTLRGIAPEILEDDDALADFVDELRQVPSEFTRNPALEDELTGLLSGASSGGAQDEMFAGLPEAVLRESLPADEFTEVHLPFLEKFDRQMEQAHDYLNREIQVDLGLLDEEERLMLMGSVMNLSPERIGDLSQAYQNVLKRKSLREDAESLNEGLRWFDDLLGNSDDM